MYLYDKDGNLKNQVTEGDYHVDNFAGLDEKSRTLYFTANGVDKNQDPYFLHTSGSTFSFLQSEI